MHLAKKYMLVEVGNNKNTVEQAKNAMVPLAKILNKVLTTN
jgi:stage II sporulation protein P